MTQHDLGESFKALDKAKDAIENAEYNLKGGFVSATANHAKTHQGAHAKFSELFVRTGIFPTEISSDISVIFDFRQEADYDLDTDITHEEATDLIRRASSFYRLTKTYLQELVQA
jgi:HEPN domain-containing protein